MRYISLRRHRDTRDVIFSTHENVKGRQGLARAVQKAVGRLDKEGSILYYTWHLLDDNSEQSKDSI